MKNQTNPYVGPRSFEAGEALYGRDRELRALSALLIAERIVLLHSPSGAGKTSLLQAGLLPHLREENFSTLPVVRVNIEPPPGSHQANRYLLSTLISLEEGFPAVQRLPLAELESLSLDEYLNQRTSSQDTVLVFDQFEEVLTISAADREGKLAFFNQLGAALRNKKRWALFSMREDYLGALTSYTRPIPNRLMTRFRLDLLSDTAAIQAMQKPAQTVGVEFTASAARKLVDDLRRVQVQMPDGSVETQLGLYIEPVQLQVVLYNLWENKNPDDNQIDEDELAGVGDVNQSLAEYYALSISRVAQSSGIPERSIREWFDHKLITPDGIRGQVRLGAESSEGLPNTAIRKLEDTHLIRADQRAGQIWYELSHDRMIEPVRADNQKWSYANLSLFQRQSALWAERERSEGLLLRGLELDVAEEQSRSITLTPDEGAFLEACRVQRKREQRDETQQRIIVTGLVFSIILTFVAVFFAVSALNAKNGLQLAVNTAQAASTQAIAQQAVAQAASTQAIEQQSIAQAASTQAIAQRSNAQAASTQSVDFAHRAATAEAAAYAEKAKANEQERIALAQSKIAQSSALVAQSLYSESKLKNDMASLLAIEAIRVVDDFNTRYQLLGFLGVNGRLPLAQSSNSGLTPNIAFGLDSTSLISINYYNCATNNYFLCSAGGVIKLWKIKGDSLPGSKNTWQISQDGAPIDQSSMLDTFAISPDGKTMASAECRAAVNTVLQCTQENIILWDLSTRKITAQKMSFSADISNDKNVRLVFSPDGKTLALVVNIPTVFNNGSSTHPIISLWDLQSFKQTGQIDAPDGAAQLVFSPNGKILAFGSGPNISLVESDSLKQVNLVKAVRNVSKNVISLAFSADGSYLASGSEDNSIILWDTQTYTPFGHTMTNISKPTALAFSPDGKILAAGYYDAGLVFWDVSSQQRLVNQAFYKHTEQEKDNYPVFSLAYSPDGKILASSSNEIILWDMDPLSWMNKNCALAGRNFSQLESELYFPHEAYHLTCPQFPAGN